MTGPSPEEEDDNEFHIDLTEEANAIISEIMDWDIGDYVAVRYNSTWFPGVICSVCDDGAVNVSCMEYVDESSKLNKFRWPSREDKNRYDRDDLLLKLEKPVPISKGKRLLHYKLSDDDYNDAFEILTVVMK